MSLAVITIFSNLMSFAPEPVLLLALGLAMIFLTVILRRFTKVEKTTEVHLTKSGE
jgi:hypothetical protein